MPYDPTVFWTPLPGETLASVLTKFAVAAALGAIIGIEREIQNQSAGLRTHMLTSLAAAAFTVVAWAMYHDVQQQAEGSQNVDPIRVVEAVTAGIAFLGAGAIIQSHDRVLGLTTGAGMWVAGAAGVATGCGYYTAAFSLTVIAFAVLSLLKWIERRTVSRPPEDPPPRA
ncbi:MAG: MgtC/SapB family protein [Thalassobaculum sp.]|uniref:MgtC/SapB family protein n=1 Tax=Thalassobaculum sp. TaxID=2022740 RepID=UPI0032EFB1C3